jgi:hypothetical protein
MPDNLKSTIGQVNILKASLDAASKSAANLDVTLRKVSTGKYIYVQLEAKKQREGVCSYRG